MEGIAGRTDGQDAFNGSKVKKHYLKVDCEGGKYAGLTNLAAEIQGVN